MRHRHHALKQRYGRSSAKAVKLEAQASEIAARRVSIQNKADTELLSYKEWRKLARQVAALKAKEAVLHNKANRALTAALGRAAS